MRILIFGAGVIGSIFGGMLAKAGHDVTFCARGARKSEIESKGLLLTNALTDEETRLKPRLTNRVMGEFDLFLVAIRKSQLDAVLPQLRTISATTSILFMVNCPLEVGRLMETLGPSRTYFAFPGAGGTHDGDRIRYALVDQQKSTFGPVRGQPDQRLRELAATFSDAGFATEIVPDMEAWLLTHCVMITSICGALYRNGASSAVLAKDKVALTDILKGLGEGLAVISALGFMPSPLKLRLLSRVPYVFGRLILSRLFVSRFAKFAIDGHANAAPEDMQVLSVDCRTMVRKSGIAAPTLLQLCDEVDVFCKRSRRHH
jgi:2-dehydropantoate 2-reductase